MYFNGLTLASCTICCNRKFCSLKACAKPSGQDNGTVGAVIAKGSRDPEGVGGIDGPADVENRELTVGELL